jgi:methylenetetrahydrofolate reductase (NADPH)
VSLDLADSDNGRRRVVKKVHILAGVAPVRSAKAFIYMKDNVAGMSVPDGLIARTETAKDSKEEGINICIETIEKVKI